MVAAIKPAPDAPIVKLYKRCRHKHHAACPGSFETWSVCSCSCHAGMSIKAPASIHEVKAPKIAKANPPVVKAAKAYGLLETLRAAARVAAKRSPLPICCEMVRLEDGSELGQLRVTATDLDTYFEAETAGIVDYVGPACVVNVKALIAAIGSAKNVRLEHSGARLVVRADGATTDLATLDANDFPSMPAGDFEDFAAVSVDGLRWAVEACSRDDARPALSAVRIGDDGSLTASDGFRLRATSRETSERYALIPFKSVAAIPIDATSCQRTTNGLWLRFVGANYTLTVHAIQGSFPNFAQLIPDETVLRYGFTAKAADVKAALDAVRHIAKDGAGIVRMTAAKGDSVVTMFAKSEELGDALATFPAELDLEPDGLKWAANLAYLDAMVKGCGDAAVSMRGSAPSNPALFAEGASIEIIMPMSVQW